MSLSSRVQLLLHGRALRILNELEDPREILEVAVEYQRESLLSLRRGRIELAAARRQLERERDRLRERQAHQGQQARRAVAAGRDDLAREALTRQQRTLADLQALDGRLRELEQQEQRYTAAEQTLAARAAAFTSRRTVASALYTAAEARVHLEETLRAASLEPDATTIGVAVERAEASIERMQARAEALSETGDPLGGVTIPGDVGATGDPLERELSGMETAAVVEERLAALKREMAAAAGGETGETGEERPS